MKVDERSNIDDLLAEHQNIGQPSPDIPTSATHPQLFEQSLLRKEIIIKDKDKMVDNDFSSAFGTIPPHLFPIVASPNPGGMDRQTILALWRVFRGSSTEQEDDSTSYKEVMGDVDTDH
ncbi:hypothetical protein Fot_35259 [Forsythia ovata]|uniref:Uncharacterized protein n=1 Tax=Forsythia ovata TaxID=205694 RepID=A0ABD1SL05_9LAMI